MALGNKLCACITRPDSVRIILVRRVWDMADKHLAAAPLMK